MRKLVMLESCLVRRLRGPSPGPPVHWEAAWRSRGARGGRRKATTSCCRQQRRAAPWNRRGTAARHVWSTPYSPEQSVASLPALRQQHPQGLCCPKHKQIGLFWANLGHNLFIMVLLWVGWQLLAGGTIFVKVTQNFFCQRSGRSFD